MRPLEQTLLKFQEIVPMDKDVLDGAVYDVEHSRSAVAALLVPYVVVLDHPEVVVIAESALQDAQILAAAP